MEIFAYRLFGSKPDKKTKDEISKLSKSSRWGWLKAQFWTLGIGVMIFILWAAGQI